MATRRGKIWVGVDVGGTQVKIGVMSSSGQLVVKRRLKTPQVDTPRAFVRWAHDELDMMLQRLGYVTRQVVGVGWGIPGPVNHVTGRVRYLVNLPGWQDVPLAKHIRAHWRCPAIVDNDVNMMAQGELIAGAVRGAKHAVCLTLGTGLGGALIVDGRLYRGVGGAAGELGHLVWKPGGYHCPCGGRGCLEQYVARGAVERMAKLALRRKRAGRLWRLTGGQPRHVTPALITQAARSGDRLAQRVWAQVGQILGTALGGLTNVLNPECIVIGGGLSGAGRWLLTPVRQALREQAMPGAGDHVRVVRARLGEWAGVIGSAVLARDAA